MADQNVHTTWAAPILRWAGSKRKLLPYLIDAMPSKYNRYIEPFAGSACLFFSLHPKKAVLGDINSELLDTYATLRDHPRRLSRAAKSIGETEDNYYKIRRVNPSELDPLSRAARFIYLNRFCFNGVYRTNQQGHFNVPRGNRTGGIPPESTFYRCSVALRAADLRPGDFEQCINDIQKDDFVYLDPPYASEGRPRAGEYGCGCFSNFDHERLIKCLKQIDKNGASFLLSYSNTPDLIRRFSKRWRLKCVSVNRHVAGFSQHRHVAEEILVSNYRAK